MTSVDEFLEHYGVKGQKWGVRNDKGHEGQRARTRKIAKLDKKFDAKARLLNTHIQLHNRAAELSNKNDVDRINNKREYKNKDFTRDSPLRQKYYKEHQDAYLDNLEKAANELGTNASGTKKYSILEGSGGAWQTVLSDVKHTDVSNDVVAEVMPHYDSMGHITSLEVVDSKVEQSIFSGQDFLEHYGIKGQKWGVRSKRRRSAKEVKAIAKRQKVSDGRRTISDSDLKTYIERLNQEKKLKTLVDEDLKPGRTVAKRVMSDSGQKVARTVVAGAGLLAVKVVLERKFDPKDAANYLAPRPKNK